MQLQQFCLHTNLIMLCSQTEAPQKCVHTILWRQCSHMEPYSTACNDNALHTYLNQPCSQKDNQQHCLHTDLQQQCLQMEPPLCSMLTTEEETFRAARTDQGSPAIGQSDCQQRVAAQGGRDTL
jgi:hypothetical protein